MLLLSLDDSVCVLRELTYKATTVYEEILLLVKGLSNSISEKAFEVKKLRAFLIVSPITNYSSIPVQQLT